MVSKIPRLVADGVVEVWRLEEVDRRTAVYHTGAHRRPGLVLAHAIPSRFEQKCATLNRLIPEKGRGDLMVGRLKLAECEDGFIWRDALRGQ
jgi:hypothetical protein